MMPSASPPSTPQSCGPDHRVSFRAPKRGVASIRDGKVVQRDCRGVRGEGIGAGERRAGQGRPKRCGKSLRASVRRGFRWQGRRRRHVAQERKRSHWCRPDRSPADRDSGRTARLVRDSWDACVMVSALILLVLHRVAMLPHEMSCPDDTAGGMHRKVGGGDVVAWYAPVWAVRRPDVAGMAIRRSVRNPLASMHGGRRLGAGAGRQRYAKRTGMIGSPAEVLQGDGDCPSSHKGMNGADGSLRSCSFRNSSRNAKSGRMQARPPSSACCGGGRL